MAIQVPPSSAFAFQTFLDLPGKKVEDLSNALSSADQAFNVSELAEDVAERSGLPIQLVVALINALAGLYLTKERVMTPIGRFVDEIVSEILSAINEGQQAINLGVWNATAPTPGSPVGDHPRSKAVSGGVKHQKNVPDDTNLRQDQTVRLSEFLKKVLSFHSTLGVVAKAGNVLVDHERIFVDARILTDIRPIFHPDVSEAPNAAVVVHMLRITQRDILAKRKTLYFALDGNDLRSLRDLLDRAIKKEETLKKAMEPSQIKLLTPKNSF